MPMDNHESGTVIVYAVHERFRGDLSFEIRDRAGIAIPGSALTSARMSLYLTANTLVPTVFINGRQLQNILNANNVTISEQGLVTWDIQELDMQIFDENLFFEPRIAVFELISPTAVILHEAAFNVRNIPQV
jgi:hypothetical protein